MNVREKSIGELFDSLVTNSLRCWFAQEDIMNESLPNEKRLEAAILAQTTNAKRNALIKAINSILNQEDMLVEKKTYDK